MSRIFKIIKRVIIKFYDDSCLTRASGLAYSSLLAMVPFITIMYAFGGFDALGKTIEAEILKAIIPAQHEAVSQALNAFTRNSITTGTLGMIFFLLTSIFLINTIARNFDAIWGVYSNTHFFRKYASYTALLVFGSLLLGVSNSFAATIQNYIGSVGNQEIHNIQNLFKSVLPFIITFIIFFFMLKLIPSSKVKLKSAVIGSIFSAVFFEIIKLVFKYWVQNSVKVSLIYGSVAIILIFLVGLYLFWLIVLIGVEISCFIQNESSEPVLTMESLNCEEKILTGLEIFMEISKSYTNNQIGGLSIKELESKLPFSTDVIDYYITKFINDGLILNINNHVSVYIPSRSLDKIYLKDIVSSIYGKSSRLFSVSDLSINSSKSFTRGGFDSLEKASILDLINKVV